MLKALPYVTAILKGPSGNRFGLKAGNAQSGALTTMWDGARPSPGYSPKKLQGAIILGTGGDGSKGGTGTFFEGAMTSGNLPDATDDLIQANIVAAGYGH
jgi:non-reducing end alpha-L-arabinofuranosidase